MASTRKRAPPRQPQGMSACRAAARRPRSRASVKASPPVPLIAEMRATPPLAAAVAAAAARDGTQQFAVRPAPAAARPAAR
eukprot:189846-Chlamydomonas_euryale.AAC.1